MDCLAVEYRKDNKGRSRKYLKYNCEIHGEFWCRSDHICPCKHCTGVIAAKRVNALRRPIEYPEWFINELVREEDKVRAKNGSLSTQDTVVWKCSCGVEYEMYVHNIVTVKGKVRYRKGRRPCCKNCRDSKRNKASHDSKMKGIVLRKQAPQWYIDDLAFPWDKYEVETYGESSTCGKRRVYRKRWFRCSKCGEIYEQGVKTHLGGSSHPKCSVPHSKTGKIEDALVEYFSQFYKVQQSVNGLIKNPTGHWMQVDMYFPDLNFAVEVDGEFWHVEEYDSFEEYIADETNRKGSYRTKKWKGYGQWKTDRCADIGIKLIHVVPEDGLEECIRQIEEAINEIAI